ncbi:MAG: diadenylate cyclase CdaA [Lachnospiraceae bacterium]|nr:diadenylate cyclase CdaA [Lachnospiraceae bacterium]
MGLLEKINEYLKSIELYRVQMDIGDLLEVLIIAFLLYYILVWMKTTRAWLLLKGLIVIAIFLALAYFFEMTTIIWMAQNILGFAVTALIIVLQPELRNALEELGKKSLITNVLPFDAMRGPEGGFSEKTIDEIVRACTSMSKVRTGALIVIERAESLKVYESSGIVIDGYVSSQLLINIFEHNTPLHDGAVIIRGDRITAATCYLPRTEKQNLSKELGTRHRAGVGMSEVTDSFTIIVSEETGKISVAFEGQLESNFNADSLKQRMYKVFIKEEETEKNKRKRKGRSKAE